MDYHNTLPHHALHTRRGPATAPHRPHATHAAPRTPRTHPPLPRTAAAARARLPQLPPRRHLLPTTCPPSHTYYRLPRPHTRPHPTVHPTRPYPLPAAAHVCRAFPPLPACHACPTPFCLLPHTHACTCPPPGMPERQTGPPPQPPPHLPCPTFNWRQGHWAGRTWRRRHSGHRPLSRGHRPHRGRYKLQRRFLKHNGGLRAAGVIRDATAHARQYSSAWARV